MLVAATRGNQQWPCIITALVHDIVSAYKFLNQAFQAFAASVCLISVFITLIEISKPGFIVSWLKLLI